jgi:hypothetical protein
MRDIPANNIKILTADHQDSNIRLLEGILPPAGYNAI